ncbi:MAG: hypothetical protein H0U95_16060 [Bacteroidetes bacterium]|nr:hypothetical protein [Bacteroidota bacterium]
MKKNKLFFIIVLSLACIFFSACGKGYEARITNYDNEPLDTVIIGNNIIIFTKIEREATTEYRKITSGDQAIKFITKTKKVYTGKISVPKKGTGKRTIQIDGLNNISILED